MEHYFLSVDGGGTKTEFLVCNEDKSIQRSFFANSSNYKSVGRIQALDALREGLRLVRETMSITLNDITYSVFGLSGIDSDSDYDFYHQFLLQEGFKEEKLTLCNDTMLAFYSQAEEPGLVVISGTGSIVMGVGRNGRTTRCGGWGYPFSDIGSGWWLGNEALKYALLYCDGCIPYSPLFELVRSHFQAETFSLLPYLITEVTEYNKIAACAPYVLQAAGDRIPLAESILSKGVNQLVKWCKSVYDRLDFSVEERIRIVFAGGVLNNELYRQFLKKELKQVLPPEKLVWAVDNHCIDAAGKLFIRQRRLGNVKYQR